MNPIKSIFSFKIVNSVDKTFIVFSAGKREGIDYSNLDKLETPAAREYLLPFECTKIAKGSMIRYDITRLISLSEYLKSDLSLEQYFDIISGIGKVVRFCQQENLSCDNLVFDPKYMFYSNTAKRVLMAYIPMNNKHYVRYSIPKCLKGMHDSVKHVGLKPAMGIYEKHLQEYAESAKKKDALEMRKLNEEFFSKVDPERLKKEAECQSSGAAAPDPFRGDSQPVQPQSYGTPSTQTGIAGAKADMDEVSLTDSEGVRHDIKKFPFSVGRSSGKDLVIEQGTVSGNHAVITSENGHYYIKDTSTNGTFVNDTEKRISYAEINDGDKIYFDQFCYTFSVTRNISDDGSARTVIVSNRNAAIRNNDDKASEKNDGESSVRALAYLKKRSDNSVIKITDYPFTSPEISGVVIYALSLSETKSLFIKNVSCSSLMFEEMPMKEDASEELFSGCSLRINGEKYMFIVEN